MTPEGLLVADKIYVTPPSLNAKDYDQSTLPGAVIEASYRQCANKYQKIAECIDAVAYTYEFRDKMPTIWLDRDETILRSLVRMTAMLSVTPYRPGFSGFRAAVIFQKIIGEGDAARVICPYTQETLCAPYVEPSPGFEIPEFLKDPNAPPYGDWSDAVYRFFAPRVVPRIHNAKQSTNWLLRSRKDSTLNPGLCDQVREAFPDAV